MQACISYGRRHRDAPGFWLLATDYTPSVTSKHDLDAEILAAKFCLAPAGTGWGTRPPHNGHNPGHTGLQPQGRSPSPQPHASRLQPHALRLQPNAPRLQPRVSQPAAPRLQAVPHACRPRLMPAGRAPRLQAAPHACRWGMRVFHMMVLGCVPVLVQDDGVHQPVAQACACALHALLPHTAHCTHYMRTARTLHGHCTPYMHEHRPIARCAGPSQP